MASIACISALVSLLTTFTVFEFVPTHQWLIGLCKHWLDMYHVCCNTFFWCCWNEDGFSPLYGSFFPFCSDLIMIHFSSLFALHGNHTSLSTVGYFLTFYNSFIMLPIISVPPRNLPPVSMSNCKIPGTKTHSRFRLVRNLS